MRKKINILYEDTHIIVCEKPVGIPSQADTSSGPDMVNMLKNHVFENDKTKGGEKTIPYIAVVHRLDRPVGGVMVYAKTPFAAKELSRQVSSHTIEKNYFAVVTRDLSKDIGKQIYLQDYLKKDGRTNTSKVASQEEKDAKKAELYYEPVKAVDGNTLIKVQLLTGRHHQIRVQMKAHAGGLLGDRKYNGEETKKADKIQGIRNSLMLYAYLLEFMHPKTKQKMKFVNVPKTGLWEMYSTDVEC